MHRVLEDRLTVEQIGKELHDTALAGQYDRFAFFYPLSHLITSTEWKELFRQLLYDAVSGGDYRIVELVANDNRIDPEEELGLHHELYYLAMQQKDATAIVAVLLSTGRLWALPALHSAQKFPNGPNRLVIETMLRLAKKYEKEKTTD